jgi:hypothetical protein
VEASALSIGAIMASKGIGYGKGTALPPLDEPSVQPRAPKGPSGIGIPKGRPKAPPGPKFSKRQGKRGA